MEAAGQQGSCGNRQQCLQDPPVLLQVGQQFSKSKSGASDGKVAAVDAGRTTKSGCACKQEWSYLGQNCWEYCCNPDGDASGDWCYVADPNSCPEGLWGSCSPPGASTTLSTTSMQTTTTASEVWVPQQALEHFEIVRKTRADGHTCPGGQVFAPNPTPLLFDCRLASLAADHSQDMLEKGFLDAAAPGGGSPTARAKELGFDVAAASVCGVTPDAQSTFNLFLSSGPHCEIIMNSSWSFMGVGYAAGGIYSHYWTQLFAMSSEIDEAATSCVESPVVSLVAPLNMETPLLGSTVIS